VAFAFESVLQECPQCLQTAVKWYCGHLRVWKRSCRALMHDKLKFLPIAQLSNPVCGLHSTTLYTDSSRF
jgi:hypothetical protein